MPDKRTGIHPDEKKDIMSAETDKETEYDETDILFDDLSETDIIEDPDEPDREKGELLQYLQRKSEKKRRREKQVRTLWFILAVTVLLSVFTIVFVGTRLAAGTFEMPFGKPGGSSSPGKAAGTVSEGSDISESQESTASDTAAEPEEGTDSGHPAESEKSAVSGSTAETEENAASVSAVETEENEASVSAAETEENTADGSTAVTEQDAAAGSAAESEEAAAAESGETTEEGTAAPSGVVDEVTFVAAGDNLIHQRLYEQAAARSEDGSYDFSYAYEMAAPFISQHDIAWIDVETLINNRLEPSGYPDFSTPGENGNALLEAGFNVFSLASNHTYDFGAEGVRATLDFWSENLPDSALTTGLWENGKYEDIPILTTEQGYRIAFLTYVDFMNGAPEEKMPRRVILLAEEDLIRDQIQLAREKADAVVVSCHWGEEGSHGITEEQMLMSQKVADWGADIIIGDHTHVIQNAAWITAADGRRVFCVYSLGNFISTQELPDELIGQLFEVTLRFMDGPDGKLVEVADPALVPTLTVYGEDGTESRVVLYSDVTNEEIREHGIRTAFPEFNRAYIEKVIRENVNGLYLNEPLTEFEDDGEEEPETEAGPDGNTEDQETGSDSETAEDEIKADRSEPEVKEEEPLDGTEPKTKEEPRNEKEPETKEEPQNETEPETEELQTGSESETVQQTGSKTISKTEIPLTGSEAQENTNEKAAA